MKQVLEWIPALQQALDAPCNAEPSGAPMLQHLPLLHIIQLLELSQVRLSKCAFLEEVIHIHKYLLHRGKACCTFLGPNVYQMKSAGSQVHTAVFVSDKGHPCFGPS